MYEDSCSLLFTILLVSFGDACDRSHRPISAAVSSSELRAEQGANRFASFVVASPRPAPAYLLLNKLQASWLRRLGSLMVVSNHVSMPSTKDYFILRAQCMRHAVTEWTWLFSAESQNSTTSQVKHDCVEWDIFVIKKPTRT